jgi:hypothetical protein
MLMAVVLVEATMNSLERQLFMAPVKAVEGNSPGYEKFDLC